MKGGGQVTAANGATTVTDPDGASDEIFPLPTDAVSLEQLLRGLFKHHWLKISFEPWPKAPPGRSRRGTRQPNCGRD